MFHSNDCAIDEHKENLKNLANKAAAIESKLPIAEKLKAAVAQVTIVQKELSEMTLEQKGNVGGNGLKEIAIALSLVVDNVVKTGWSTKVACFFFVFIL